MQQNKKNQPMSLRYFLIHYTAIPIKFIDKHLEFYDMCNTDMFGIDIDNVIKYLEILKRKKFIETIKKKFVENIDYIITRDNKKAIKGDRIVHYKLSLDTFEKICMKTNSKKR